MNNMREEVIKFAQAMENELHENEWKGHWCGCDKEYLTVKLMEEIHELFKAIMQRDSDDKVLSEAADVSNIVMMIADNYISGRFE
jgi:NTP pyrophosphatase (non-canonical NTP hydrolase)